MHYNSQIPFLISGLNLSITNKITCTHIVITHMQHFAFLHIKQHLPKAVLIVPRFYHIPRRSWAKIVAASEHPEVKKLCSQTHIWWEGGSQPSPRTPPTSAFWASAYHLPSSGKNPAIPHGQSSRVRQYSTRTALSMLNSQLHQHYTLCFLRFGPLVESYQTGKELSHPCTKERAQNLTVAAVIQYHFCQCQEKFLHMSLEDYSHS